MAIDKFSKGAIMKKLRGKHQSKAVNKAYAEAGGVSIHNKTGIDKAIATDLAFKSKFSRNKILKNIRGLKAPKRKEVEGIFGNTKSSAQLKKEEKIADRKRKANVALGRKMDESMKAKRRGKGSIGGQAADSSRLGIAGADYQNTASGGTVSSQDKRGGGGPSSGGGGGYANNPTSGGLTRGSGGATGVGGSTMPSGGGGGMPGGGGAPLGF